uniref:Uncharacterized protein n=1 Tax=Romanomermis culicivorax TaxID=13658 RepID=A0A915KUF2_ROMCU
MHEYRNTAYVLLRQSQDSPRTKNYPSTNIDLASDISVFQFWVTKQDNPTIELRSTLRYWINVCPSTWAIYYLYEHYFWRADNKLDPVLGARLTLTPVTSWRPSYFGKSNWWCKYDCDCPSKTVCHSHKCEPTMG